MKNYLKQFEASVTGLKHNLFFAARLRLAGYYAIVIALIVAVFSLVLYFALASDLRGNLEGEFADEQTQAHIISRTTDGLQRNILFQGS